jgi:hypothetical protein
MAETEYNFQSRVYKVKTFGTTHVGFKLDYFIGILSFSAGEFTKHPVSRPYPYWTFRDLFNFFDCGIPF